MRRIRIIIGPSSISLAALSGGGVSAETSDKIPKGIGDYLRVVIAPEAEEASRQGDSWEWEQTGKGGYLTRYYSDVTGDGRPELFVTTSLSKNESEWSVFRIAENGALFPYNQKFEIGKGGWMKIDNDRNNSLLVLYTPSREEQREAKEDWKYPLARFEFDYPNIHESFSRVDASEAESIQVMPSPVDTKAEFVLLVDYLNDPSIPWRTDGNWQGVEYQMEVSDIDRITKNTDFTPAKALALLEQHVDRSVRASDRGNSSFSKASRSERGLSGANEKSFVEQKIISQVWPWILGGTVLLFVLWRFLNRLRSE